MVIMAKLGIDRLKVGLVQAKLSDKIEANLGKTAKYIQKAARKGAVIVCLQELFAMPYFPQKENKQLFDLAEKIPGKITNFLSKTAEDNKITLVGGSLFEKGEGGRYYNTTLVFDQKGIMIGKYRKIHIPHDPNYYEQFYFSSGNLGYVQAEVQGVRIAPLICYDQWYPEAARVNALKGAQMIFYPTAIGWIESMRKMEPFSQKRWEQVHCSHASVNGIFVAAVNRVGNEGKTEFWGNSLVADPFGNVIARASSDKEEILFAELDLSLIESSQKGWGFLKGRRPDTYSDLVKR